MMDKVEAREILSEQINKLRKIPYNELLEFQEPHTEELVGGSGTTYQLEVQAFWDNKPNDSLRVMVSIDDGGWRSFVPLTDDFIIAPDGSFVGE